MQAERLNIDEFNSNINRFRHDESLKQSLHFDDRLDEVLNIVEELLLRKGFFHLVVHFSSSQISCCTFDNLYSFQLFTAEEVFSNVFMQHFVSTGSRIQTSIRRNQVRPLLDALKYLRNRKQNSELRNASLHLANGLIGLSFACDDTRYINFKDLLRNI